MGYEFYIEKEHCFSVSRKSKIKIGSNLNDMADYDDKLFIQVCGGFDMNLKHVDNIVHVLNMDRISSVREQLLFMPNNSQVFQNWFAKHVCFGIYDHEYTDNHIDIADLIHLRNTCRKVIEKPNLAERFLSIPDDRREFDDYDEDYFFDIQYVLERLESIIEEERALKKYTNINRYLYYRAVQ